MSQWNETLHWRNDKSQEQNTQLGLLYNTREIDGRKTERLRHHQLEIELNLWFSTDQNITDTEI